MALRSKLLDKKVVNLAKEMLKKVRNNAYVSKKLQEVIAGKGKSLTFDLKLFLCSENVII